MFLAKTQRAQRGNSLNEFLVIGTRSYRKVVLWWFHSALCIWGRRKFYHRVHRAHRVHRVWVYVLHTRIPLCVSLFSVVMKISQASGMLPIQGMPLSFILLTLQNPFAASRLRVMHSSCSSCSSWWSLLSGTQESRKYGPERG